MLDSLTAIHAQLTAGRSVVMVTVGFVQGSTPRDAGARLWVDADTVSGTIGGGNLEWQAIAQARQMLIGQSPAVHWQRYALGPSLGQCCGGAVSLLYERLGPPDLDWCAAAIQALAAGQAVRRQRQVDDAGQPVKIDIGIDDETGQAGTQWDAQSQTWQETLVMQRVPVVVCGAGHVGKAIIRLLGDLPVQVVWLDSRDDQWPSSVPRNVQCLQGDEHDVAKLPADALWLVLTHDHGLDLALVQAVLQHQRFRFLGLIGSDTKAARFRSQLSRRLSPQAAAQVVCPIGVVKTVSKQPEVIAVSIVAQLLPYLDAVA